MPTTFGEADRVAAELVSVLGEFHWFHGIAVEEDPHGFFVCVRVNPRTSLEEARSKSLIPQEKHGVRVHFKHQLVARAYTAAG